MVISGWKHPNPSESFDAHKSLLCYPSFSMVISYNILRMQSKIDWEICKELVGYLFCLVK